MGGVNIKVLKKKGEKTSAGPVGRGWLSG